MRLTCYAHLLHNLVTYMLDEPKVKEILKRCAKLAAYVKNSGLNTQLTTSIKGYTPTRWNSVYTMVDGIYKNYQQIYDVLIMKQRLVNEVRIKNKLSPDNVLSELILVLQQSELKDIRDLLEPFKVRFHTVGIFQSSI